jgi:Response regulator containing CheY-like receiver domain and AraC-type DNA-binding domain
MRVLIVDDEMLIRNGLKTIIKESQTGFTDIFEASNGKEAFDVISENQIDLAVIDIRMPIMDGIALMKAAQGIVYKPEFVILTGYDDFQYAKESIKYGAKAYLLKPVRRIELNEVIINVEQDIIRKKKDILEKEKINTMINGIREHKLNRLIMNDFPCKQDLEDTLNFANSEIPSGRYYMAVILKRRDKAERERWNNELLFDISIISFIEKLMQPVLTFYSIDGNLVVISGDKKVFQDLSAYIRDKETLRYIIGLSSEVYGADNMKKAYQQACEALKYQIIRTSDVIIPFDDLNKLNKNFIIPSDRLQKVEQLIGTRRIDEINDILNSTFDYNKILENDISYAIRLAESAYDYIIYKYSGQLSQQQAGTSGFISGYLRDIFKFDSFKDYFHAFKKCVYDINECLLALNVYYKERNEIETAMEFIESNYHKDLNLAVVANHVSLNYSYFSNLFSCQMGMGFHDYLKKVRIEKSKELLKNTEFKINEIAKKVGYKNPKHFAVNFRSLTSMSPMEFREKNNVRP